MKTSPSFAAIQYLLTLSILLSLDLRKSLVSDPCFDITTFRTISMIYVEITAISVPLAVGKPRNNSTLE